MKIPLYSHATMRSARLSGLGLAAGLVFLMALPVTGLAQSRDPHCFAPMRNRMPVGLLRQQLDQQGWQVQSIRLIYGCYVVQALDANGEQVRAYF
ncbi:MAG: PepSY domain-containing protein, partial [Hoeflea sp. D1-CHI-28]